MLALRHALRCPVSIGENAMFGDDTVHVHRLDGATNMWMDSGTWVGTMTDIIWDEDGEMFRLNPRTAVWTPPDPLRRSHRCACHAPLRFPV